MSLIREHMSKGQGSKVTSQTLKMRDERSKLKVLRNLKFPIIESSEIEFFLFKFKAYLIG